MNIIPTKRNKELNYPKIFSVFMSLLFNLHCKEKIAKNQSFELFFTGLALIAIAHIYDYI